MIDVLTVTKRHNWYELALESIQRQRMDIHWVIVDEHMLPQEEHQTMDFRGDNVLMTTFLSAPPKTRISNLNASLNKGLRFCQTDVVIFYQDLIILQDNCFRDLVDLSMANDYAFVGTVTKNPPDEHDDMRYLKVDCLRPCMPEEWEANVGLAPMAIIQELGGFDEEYDNGWSWDNVNIAERAAMLGCKFFLDEANRPQLLSHSKEKSMSPNGEFHAQRMREIKDGKRPIRVPYL
jgi:hypothetical protein